LSAVTYYFSRRRRRVVEVERIFTLLKLDPSYRKAYGPDSASSYAGGVLYVSTVAGIGLALLFFSHEIGLVNGEFPKVALGDVEFPQPGSRIIFAMAFLGSYLAALQHIYRRYATTDLSATVYYAMAMQMLTASVFALVIYNGYSALSGTGDADG